MKINGTLSAICIALFVNFTLISGRALDTRDLITPVSDDLLFARAKGGNNKGGSSSGSTSTTSKKSQVKKGATTEATDGELGTWGLQRTRHEDNDFPPKPFNWDNEANDQYDSVGGTWKVAIIGPDSGHVGQYGEADVYQYQTNVDAGAFHTDAVYTTADNTGKARSLPTNRRALTYNAWIDAGGDPAELLKFSDENIENGDAKEAFESALEAMEGHISRSEGEQWVRISTQDEAWAHWDNGKNPFPAGYKKMTEDYPDMHSEVDSVMLYVDESDLYNAVHFMKPYEALD
ncbi:hypothetical protein F5Y04DRAFT_280819 [Hypomontagnella monticulosa]|nr:hypothetical protein F5Y04DRAFT_280819 [Hypomontagnella monticulosa]